MLNLKKWMQKVTEWIYQPTVNRAASGVDTFYRANNTDTSVSVGFGVGSGGTNHGIWSSKLGKWLIHGDASNVYVNGVQFPNGLQPQYQQVYFPYTPTKNGILVMFLRANADGRVYATLSTGVPSLSDGYTIAGGYVVTPHFCNAGSSISVPSSYNMRECIAYYVTWS